VAALLIYRLGKHIPLPGIDYSGMIETLYYGGTPNVAGATERMSIFALGIWPYISASLVMLCMIWIVPPLASMTKSRAGRLNQYMRVATVVIAGFQAYAIAGGLEHVHSRGESLVLDPGLSFRVSTMATLIGASLFLAWLSERITARGLGNGVLLILFADLAAGLPEFVLAFMEYLRQHPYPYQPKAPFATGALMLAAIVGVVFVELARRRVLFEHQARKAGGGHRSYLPLKLNPSGLAPLFLAPALAGMLSLIAYQIDPIWFEAQGKFWLGLGQPVHLLLLGALIVLFAMSFRTVCGSDPAELAAGVQKSGGVIPGLAEGERATDHIASMQTRIAAFGALYLAAVGLMPELLYGFARTAFNFGGWPLLVLVMVPVAVLEGLRRTPAGARTVSPPQ